MRKFFISQADLSELFWRKIFWGSRDVSFKQLELQRALSKQEVLRSEADFNTGSISFSKAWALYSLTRYFAPTNIIEIGTFIGKSTISMAYALDDLLQPGKIQTCDMSNGFDIKWEGKTDIVQNFKTGSTELLNKVEAPQDLLFIDGSLTNEDVEIIATANFENCVFVFDDTEGAEKGTINQVLVSQKIKNRCMLYPPSRELLKEENLSEYSNLSLSIPYGMFQMSRQG